MKILTWNINGIRSGNISLDKIFKGLDADIICLQETKVTRDQLDEPSAVVEGYNSYFSFSKTKSGYSGVATFAKDSCIPIAAEEGLTGILKNDSGIGGHTDLSSFSEEEIVCIDNEGRAVITQFNFLSNDGEEKKLTVINVYCPRADPEREDRKIYKLQFYNILQLRAEAFLREGSHVIILGDVNTSHKPIDNCNACEDEEDEEGFAQRPGRQWLTQLLLNSNDGDKKVEVKKQDTPEETGDMGMTHYWKNELHEGRHFVDTFRISYPERKEAYTCWSTVTGARATNYGTRIDYILGDQNLVKMGLIECDIMPDFEGSDHCPVKAQFDIEIIAAKKCPPLCSKYLPEFAGKQQKLSNFFSIKLKKDANDIITKKENKNNHISLSQSSLQKAEAEMTLKRAASEPLNTNNTKRSRTELKKTDSNKQASLTSYFGSKEKKHNNVSNDRKPSEKSTFTMFARDEHAKGQQDELEGSKIENLSLAVNVINDIESGKQISTSWRNLLSGPSPAPLCKGHKEPCVLRTVKKDSLNKGRQFYVCCKPDGPKSNPNARCDHFEWVEKKKKTL